MFKITEEQKRIINLEYEETLLWLIEKISKYQGKYSTKQLKEWLTSLLMLEIDIQKDNTYNEEILKGINKIGFTQLIFNFNIYANIRKILEEFDENLTFPGGGYNGKSIYPVWHDRFTPNESNIPRGSADKIEILNISLPENKTTITLTGESRRSKKIRQLQIDKMIIELYKKSLEKPNTNYEPIKDYYYNMDLGQIIHILNDWICRCNEDRLVQAHGIYKKIKKINSISEEQTKINEYASMLYQLLQQEYGPFKEQFRRPEEVIGKIDIDTKGAITETYTIKETPIVTWQKKIEHY